MTEKAKTESPKSEPRMHVVKGRIPRKVVRTYYDPRQDCVIDVVEVPKLVVDRHGNEREVILQRALYCRDEAIQAKYRRADAAVEITEQEIK